MSEAEDAPGAGQEPRDLPEQPGLPEQFEQCGAAGPRGGGWAVDDLVDLPEAEFLELVETRARWRRQAEVDELRMAYVWALRHPKERLDPVVTRLPGRERARRLGGVGTPWVGEFAPATLGPRLGMSAAAARVLIADALDLVHRCPQLWARVEALEVRASYARYVARVVRELSVEQAAYVDERVVESADGRISWARFEAVVQAAVVASDVAAARAVEERAAKARFVKRVHGEAHGMASLLVRADVASIEVLDQTVTEVARRLDETAGATMDDKRVTALLLLARGTLAGSASSSTADTAPATGGAEASAAADGAGRMSVDVAALLPQVHLVVHTYAGTDAPGIARLEGHGAVTEHWLARVLGPQARITVQPVLDIAGQAPVDAYEIPDRHRRAVRLLTPADMFPYANCLSDHMQVDHTVPWQPGPPGPPTPPRPPAEADSGGSAIGNYAPLTTYHHRIKTHGRWQVRQPFPGILVWRDPYGQTYLVDHTGTRIVHRPELKIDYVVTA